MKQIKSGAEGPRGGAGVERQGWGGRQLGFGIMLGFPTIVERDGRVPGVEVSEPARIAVRP